jgi:hypothetical protein
MKGHENLKETFKSVFKVIGTPKMIRFMPQTIWTAISLSYYSGILVLEVQ